MNIRKIVEKHLIPSGYKTVHMGSAIEVSASQFISKKTIESLIEDLENNSDIDVIIARLLQGINIQVDIVRDSGICEGEWNVTKTYAVLNGEKVQIGTGVVDIIL